MKLNFRQGIVSHQSSNGVQTFLTVNTGAATVKLNADNRPVVISLAHGDSNYLFSEDKTPSSTNPEKDHWYVPLNGTEHYWLYWDFDFLTFERTFGVTTLEPVAQDVEPGAGDAEILQVIPGTGGVGAFVVSGHFALDYQVPGIRSGRRFAVVGSDDNDGTFFVHSTTYDPYNGETTIVVTSTVNAPTGSPYALGVATLDIDAYDIPLRTSGRHWYNTATNRHYVLNGAVWSEVLRVWAAHMVPGGGSSNRFIPQTITGGSYIGTQIGDTTPVYAGRVVFDESSDPIRRDDRRFFTTEDQFFAQAARVDAIRLESNVARAQSIQGTPMAGFHVVAWIPWDDPGIANDKKEGRIRLASYEDIGSTVLGMITETINHKETGAVIIQGVITNPDWNWVDGNGDVLAGRPLWVEENGELVTYDPHINDVVTYPTGQVPVARVLDRNSIVFEQGLGGKGDQGPPGSVENLPLATIDDEGVVFLVTEPDDPDLPLVVGDNDPRLTDARPPLAHNHPASDISFIPCGGITSNNVQDALCFLGNNKLNKSGGTLTGFLTLHSNPTNAFHAATKNYVDGLVSGLVWLDPVCLINFIGDNLTTPPASPNLGDTYLLPGPGTGAWGSYGSPPAPIPAGHLVQWDGLGWVDKGTPLDINPNGPRLGIAMDSTTTPIGTLAGHKNEIALFDNTGALSGYQIPTDNNAVYVCNVSSLFAYNQYAFSGTEWVLFGGASAYGPDDVTTVLNGNIFSVKQWGDGGEVDAKFWQGLEPSDLNTLYASITHNHAASTLTFTPFTSPVPGLGGVVATNIQAAVEETYNEKASLTPRYDTFASLPDATTYIGMIAHVDDEGVHYLAQSNGGSPETGSWIALATYPLSIPYDVSYFAAGQLLFTNSPIGSFLATRTITIPSGAPGALARARVAPVTAVTFTLQTDDGATTTNVGTVQFAGGSRNGTFTLAAGVTLNAGDQLNVITPGTLEPNIQDIAITIPGCAIATDCS